MFKRDETFNTNEIANGVLACLVAVTGCCPFIDPPWAILIGGIRLPIMCLCVVHVPSFSVDDILLPLGMLHCVFNEVMGWSKGVSGSWSMVSHNGASMRQ